MPERPGSSPHTAVPLCSGVTDERIVVTTADRAEDVRQILYGLSLRGIRAEVRDAGSLRGDPWQVVTDAAQAPRALHAIGFIWDAILESPVAITTEGTCPFCDYSLEGLPDASDRCLLCPECGTDLRSVAARRAVRGRGR